MYGEYDANGTPVYETVYINTNPVGVLKQTGTAGSITTTLYNVHADHLGAPRLVTKQVDQAIVWRWDTAESYGGSAPDQNPNGLGTFVYNQRFPGQLFDSETGLFQNSNREYNARLGRYMEVDPIGLDGGINPFAYVEGNPVSNIDPTGLASIPVQPKQVPGKPKPIPLYPHNCTPAEHSLLQSAVNAACSQPRSCNPTQSCSELQDNLKKSWACYEARRAINNICYNGGDIIHRVEQKKALDGINNCLNELAKPGKGCYLNCDKP